MTTWLGLDLGTSSIKCLLIDDRGAEVARTSHAYAVQHPTADAGEIDPETWWQALCQAVRSLPADLRKQVGGIGLSGQMHGVVPCTADGRACAPAQLWMDRRALEELQAYPGEGRGPCGNPLSPGMAGPMLRRLAHDPELKERIAFALQPKDWIGLRLTGDLATDPSDCSATLLAGPDGEWDSALIASLDLPRRWFVPVHPSHQQRGYLRPDVAAQLGLPSALPVAMGAADTAAALLGNGVTLLGSAQLTLGTGGQLVVIGDPGLASPLNRFRSTQPDAPWYAMAAMLNAGFALDWARRMLGMSWPDAYAVLEQPVTETDPVFVPYLAGERVPFHDPSLRGGWMRLGPHDTQESLMRAAFAGVACSLRAGLEALRDADLAPPRINLAGGGNRAPAWRQLLADMLGVPLIPAGIDDASARGAALLGGVAAGVWRIDGLPALPPRDVAIEPRATDIGDALYARFLHYVPNAR